MKFVFSMFCVWLFGCGTASQQASHQSSYPKETPAAVSYGGVGKDDAPVRHALTIQPAAQAQGFCVLLSDHDTNGDVLSRELISKQGSLSSQDIMSSMPTVKTAQCLDNATACPVEIVFQRVILTSPA